MAAILVLAFSLAGCSSSSDSADYNKELLVQQADAMISNFSQMSEEDMETFKDMSDLQLNLTLMQSGFKMEADNFVTMIDAWNSGVEECGAYVSHEDFEVEESAKSIMLVAEAKYEDRNAEITFEFTKDEEMKSFTAAAKYSMGEIMKKAGLNTLLGMGTVFAVLIFISFIISLFGLIGKNEERKAQNDGITISAVAIVSSSKPAKAEDSIAPKAVALPSGALIAPHLSLSGDTGALAEISANAIDTRSESEIPPTASNFLTKYAPEGANAILRAISYFNISYHTKFHKGQVKVFVAQKLRFLGHRATH